MTDLRLDAPELDPAQEAADIEQAAVYREELRELAPRCTEIARLIAWADSAVLRARGHYLISESRKDASLAADLYRRAESLAVEMRP